MNEGKVANEYRKKGKLKKRRVERKKERKIGRKKW